MTQTTVTTWRNYEFTTTTLDCRNRCGPGAHPLYIGMSSRPGLRYEQHADQPWWPYVSGFVVFPEVYASEADALAAEEARIHARLPLANREHNQGNPCRLDFGPAPVARRPRRSVVRPRRRPSRRRWPRPARRLMWRAGVWSGLATLIFVLVPGSVAFGTAAWDSAVGATLVMATVLLGRRRRRRRRR